MLGNRAKLTGKAISNLLVIIGSILFICSFFGPYSHANDIEDNHILFVGENHDDTDNQSHYPRLIDYYKRTYKNTNCLLLELPEDLQDTLDEHLHSNLETLKDASSEWYEQNYLDLYGRQNSTYRYSIHKSFYSFNLSLAQYAALQGLQVYLIDKPYHSKSKDPEYSTSPQGIHSRNKHMAKFIAKLHTSGQCKSSIGIFGLSHIQNYKPYQTDNIDKRLLSKKQRKQYELTIPSVQSSVYLPNTQIHTLNAKNIQSYLEETVSFVQSK